MKRRLEEIRDEAAADERLDGYAKERIAAVLDELESMVNCEIRGSIALIKRPLSEQLDWYFTYGDNRVISIDEPGAMRDRDAVKLSVVLSDVED